jgi:hypothetical protein
MEPVSSLSHLQVPVTGHYPEPDKSKFTIGKEGRRVDRATKTIGESKITDLDVDGDTT